MPDYSAEIEITFERGAQSSDRHDYRLVVKLRNLGTEPLGEYHIDLELPARVLSEDDQYMFVRDRSTRERAFFRVDSGKHRSGEVIYPGDEKSVMSVKYYMDTTLFYRHNYLLDEPVRATLYRRGFRPIAVERRFGELQEF